VVFLFSLFEERIVKLGDKVQDTVTGFTGIVTARTEFLHSGPRCLVEARVIDDTPAAAAWFDEPRLEQFTSE
jgi:hypothetical protein